MSQTRAHSNGSVERYLATNTFVAFDLETTGIDVRSDLPVSFGIERVSGGVRLAQRYELVDPGIPIPPGASAVHGISDEVVRAHGRGLSESLEVIVAELMSASEKSWIIVGMNLSYDLSLVDYAARRVLGKGLVERGFDAPVLDVLVLDREYVPRRFGKRTLDRLCEHYGVAPERLHNALSDARASFAILEVLLAQFPSITELPLGELTTRLEDYQHRWAHGFNEWRRREGLQEIEIYSWPIQAQLR
ncbi:MAG: exonuclease domain-containing protein [Acidimicrobiales bacterium]